MSLAGKRILLVISGGIAAYKSLDLIRRLRERGAEVRPVMTAGAQQFVTPLAVGALSALLLYRLVAQGMDRDLVIACATIASLGCALATVMIRPRPNP